ncbi:helix-turn-helix transcriptional regulator [Pseudoclavibacter helvolus]|uniref:helix-turn-helix transcriptional regulator n=1 Tax=Pseudoclavibacter helvolus TaxID=255205 RepID=UPI000838F6BD|nr:hypothetical protein [Pseudoclavibacter helvolus]
MTIQASTIDYLTADAVCELVPGLTKKQLSNLRYLGQGPKFLKPTPRKVLYRRADVIAWVEASEQTMTGEAGR